MTRIGMIVLLCLVAATNASPLTVKREAGSKSASKFVPSQPLHPEDFIEGGHPSEVILDKNALEISSRSSDSKASGKEDPQGNMYYYYYPSGGSEDRDGSSATSGGGYSALEAADSAASGSSSSSSGSSYGGYSGGTTGGSYGEGAVASGGKDTSHFIKVAIPLFIIGSILLGLSSLAYPSSRSLDTKPFSFLQMWEDELDKIFYNYLAALQTEQCLQRTACEAGHFAKDYSATKYLLPLLEMFSLEIMKNNTKVFKLAIQDKRDISSCKKYTCHYGKKQH